MNKWNNGQWGQNKRTNLHAATSNEHTEKKCCSECWTHSIVQIKVPDFVIEIDTRALVPPKKE